jgi:4-aminobutyrate aminotransferase-like enzyme
MDDAGQGEPAMTQPIVFPGENLSNAVRESIALTEPRSFRTYTPTQLVIHRSAGLYHYTPEGRRLADFTSGVLVANLGHQPTKWLRRLQDYAGWTAEAINTEEPYVLAPPLTAYNAISTLEEQANGRLLASLRATRFGTNLQQVMWAASGSEGIQKALWGAMMYQPGRNIILATRDGFHGKKGLAGAVSGNEESPERDPRVRFISFPKHECRDVSVRHDAFDPEPYERELAALVAAHPGKIAALVTEPYLGGGGSYHPPLAYLQLLERFCREHGIVFILDEVQSNFGRTGSMYAFETYQITPDIVVLGKGMGNGIPVNAAVGRADIFGSLDYGWGSDTWSAHPFGCAATLATLDLFEEDQVMEHSEPSGTILAAGLAKLKEYPIVSQIRGEGFVWGIEFRDFGGKSASEVACHVVRSAYVGDADGQAIHLLGPLAGKVVRISPPLTITEAEAAHWMGVLESIVAGVCVELDPGVMLAERSA